MGILRHKKHLFTNNYVEKNEKIRNGVSLVLILLFSLMVLVLLDQHLKFEDKDRWTIAIAILAVIVTFAVTFTNLHFKTKQMQTSSLFKVFELLSSHDIRESRKTVYSIYHKLKKENQKVIFTNTPYEEHADKVLSSFDQVSATVLNGLLDKDLFFDTYGEMIVRDWKTLQDEIEIRQEKNKKTLRHFTILKNQFEEILQKDKNYMDSDIAPY